MSKTPAKTKNAGDVLRCSFCNKSQKDVKKLIAGPTVYICDECVDICLDIIAEDRKSEPMPGDSLVPKALLVAADRIVCGHEQAKQVLSASVAQHAKGEEAAVSPVFLIGATGAGKSQLVKGLARAAGLPFASIEVPLLFADSPFETKHNFMGFGEAPGVIMLSHMEAVAMRGNRADECRRVQQYLISIIDGAWLQLTTESTRTNQPASFDTSRVLFVAVGDLPEDLGGDRESLTQYGYLPELVARFGVVLRLDPLSEESLREMLTREDGFLPACTARFKKYGLAVSFQPNAIEEIVDIGLRRKAGVRGLKALVDRLGIALACDASSENQLEVNAEYVRRHLR
jgi:ATP-dependent Clp protease ATP-binding subunit ClpX